MTPPPETPPEPGDSRLELALRASNEGIWDWWPDREDIYYSRRILEFLECGDRRPPNIFLPPYPSIHPEDQESFAANLRGALTSGGPEVFGVDTRVRTGSGEWRWLRIRGAVVRTRTGEAQRIAGSMIDISRRKIAEAQIEEERHLLRNFIDHVPLMVYFKDKESRFVLVNNKMAEWNRMSDPKQVVGKHDRDFFAAKHWEEALVDERQVMETGQPITAKLEEEVREDGEITWVLTSKFPWVGKNGNLRGTFGVSSDVTKLVLGEQRTAALAHELALRNQAYEEEMHLAREIQQAFARPEMPEVAGGGLKLNFASRYLPISGLAGDFFEIVPLGPDRVGLMVCDVMGHGVRSALVVSMLRGLLEKERRNAGDPSKFLTGLNRGLSSIFERAAITMFATACYVVIDLSSGEIRGASAGHPSAILAGEKGVKRLSQQKSERGPGLGLMHDARFPTTVESILPGERLLLFTDGIIEAEDGSGQAFMEHRLAETAVGTRSLALEEAVEHIVGTVLSHAEENRFDDDVCLLAIEFAKAPLAAIKV
ncbi:sigma-B regulation protein RsbU (phosphoserine phosphatase) [Haloferula luteola]|uniref:Sigma-B regulation protein RsbU (Phosphoserine phosphatase) n=1 Tax=Haloferula luteola TaxID=595692 RepID=A0A840V5D5_9BACT|nr:SpoIIE family protein phosphatase [Haloferula luteola]MBB5353182.1 sigma-B regulation protein RsbU (phosphoserine phosphatase) [Haloferula luteola]